MPNNLTRARRILGSFAGWTDIVLDSIVNPLTQLGNPNVDKGAAGAPTLRLLSPPQCEALYRCNGIARRIVDTLPDKGTSKGWRVDIPFDDEAEDASDEIDLDPFRDFDEEFDVRGLFAEAWKWARRDGTAYILILPPGDAGLGEERSEGEEIEALQVFTMDELTVQTYDDDIRSSTYRHPLTFQLSPAVGGEGSLVHASRVLTFRGAMLDPYQRYRNQGRDDSIFQALWDQIRHLTTIGQAGANLAQELRLHVVKTDVPEELDASQGAIYFDERMKLLARQKSSVGLIVLGVGEEYETQSAALTGWGELTATARTNLSAVTGIPQTELFGETPGGLNTDGKNHRQIMNDLVLLAQERFLGPPLRKLYQAAWETRGGEPDEWSIEFHPVSSLTSEEQANLEKTHAETDKIRIDSGVATPEHVAKSRFGPSGYSDQLGAIDPEDLETPTFAEMQRLMAQTEPPPFGEEPQGDQPPFGEEPAEQPEPPIADDEPPVEDEDDE